MRIRLGVILPTVLGKGKVVDGVATPSTNILSVAHSPFVDKAQSEGINDNFTNI